MKTERTSLVLCGLPESGKSTFLGALAYLINTKEIDIPIKEKKLASNRDYINQLADAWASFRVVDRTRIEDFHDIEFELCDDFGDFNLYVPDLSGETWNVDVCNNRRCPPHLAQHVSDADAILFFLHSDKLKQPVPLNALPISEALLEEQKDYSASTWDAATQMTTQASAVDLLQLLCRRPLSDSPKRLSIILSAWDIVLVEGRSPEEHLKMELPLLYQYLSAGFDFPEWQVFGISAQGGDLTQDRQTLMQIDKPSERIIVNEKGCHDLTIPIRWALKR